MSKQSDIIRELQERQKELQERQKELQDRVNAAEAICQDLLSHLYNSEAQGRIKFDDYRIKYTQEAIERREAEARAKLSIGTLIDPPICGVLDPLKTVFFVLKQSDYFLLCAPRPV